MEYLLVFEKHTYQKLIPFVDHGPVYLIHVRDEEFSTYSRS